MARLDPSARATVTQFAATMGLAAREADDGSFGFDFAESGRLSILGGADGEEVLVSLTRRLILEDVAAFARFAGQGGYDPVSDTILSAGLSRADQPVLAVAVAARAFDVPRLDATFELLRARFSAAGL